MIDFATRGVTETEIKIYLLVSLIFEKIMDAENSYDLGLYQWQKLKPDILQSIGLSEDYWTALSDYGDQNELLQERMAEIRDKYELYSRDQVLSNIRSILKSL